MMVDVEDAGTYALVGGAHQIDVQPRWRLAIKKVVNSACFKCLSLICLVIALFGGGLVTLLDLPDSFNLEMDVLMTSIALFFILEISFSCIAEPREYPLSFFFWTDVIGTCSMAFEISYILGSAGKIRESNSNLRILTVRSARAARIGARAGRLSRPLRLFTRLFRGNQVDMEPGYTARILGARLTQVFASKVAMLTVVLVLGVPLFNIGRYPEDDFSLFAWGNKLEADYARDFYALVNKTERAPHAFRDAVIDMHAFYQKINEYYPFRLDGYSSQVDSNGIRVVIHGAGIIGMDAPNRKQNILRQETSDCSVIRAGCNEHEKAAIYFDFTVPTKHDALLDMAVTIFIILCMLVESFDLNFSIDRMMVKPMERMLDSSRLMSKQLQQTLSKNTHAGKHQAALKAMTKELRSYEGHDIIDEDDEVGSMESAVDEFEMLQGLFKKVVMLIKLFTDDDAIESNEIEIGDNGDQDQMLTKRRLNRGATTNIGYNMEAVEDDDGLVRQKSKPRFSSTAKRRSGAVARDSQRSEAVIRECSEESRTTVATQSAVRLSRWGDNKNGPESWGFNARELTPPKCKALADHVLFKSELGMSTGKLWLDSNAFEGFYIALEAEYNHNEFHNFIRAMDLLACCFRWLHQMQWESWFSDLDATAILISALACDVAHPGKTNQFLVATADAMAIHYNDRSPLENMHCAKLFEIQREEKNQIFKRLEKIAMGQVRKTCIEAILHTDNASHADLVKDIKRVYAMHSDMCDAQRQNPHVLATQYTSDVLLTNTPLWRRSLLHLADKSNPCQKFEIAKGWAERLQEELFLQGDEEQRLGLPIGQRHDRRQVTLPGDQFSFINLMLSPLITSMLHVYPMISPMAEQMVENMREWHKLWCQEPSWKPTLNVQRRERIQKIADQIAEFTIAKRTTQISTHSSPWELAPSGRSRASRVGRPSHRMSLSVFNTTDFSGHWTCVGTWGLEEFLKSVNVSWARRKAAVSAPWPSWDFQQSGDNIVFNNYSALGVLKMEFTVDGQPFTQIDGWKQKNTCKAFWENKMLVILKDGPQGSYREERFIDNEGKLQFILQPLNPAGPSWGRVFEPSTR